MFIFSQLNFPYSKLRVTATDCGFCAAARPGLLRSAGKPRGRASAAGQPGRLCPAPGRPQPCSRPLRYLLALLYAFPPTPLPPPFPALAPAKPDKVCLPWQVPRNPGLLRIPARDGPKPGAAPTTSPHVDLEPLLSPTSCFSGCKPRGLPFLQPHLS